MHKGSENLLDNPQITLNLLTFNNLQNHLIFGVFSTRPEVDDLEANYRRLVVKNISTTHHSFQLPLPVQPQRRRGHYQTSRRRKQDIKKATHLFSVIAPYHIDFFL